MQMHSNDSAAAADAVALAGAAAAAIAGADNDKMSEGWMLILSELLVEGRGATRRE